LPCYEREFMADKNKADTTSILSVGGLSTTVVGVTGLTLTDYPVAVKVIALACPVVMSIIVWLITRLLKTVEPYTDEQLSQRARIANELKLLNAEIESSDDEFKEMLNMQKIKLIEQRGKLAN
jgi:hypothetical protein